MIQGKQLAMPTQSPPRICREKMRQIRSPLKGGTIGLTSRWLQVASIFLPPRRRDGLIDFGNGIGMLIVPLEGGPFFTAWLRGKKRGGD